MKNDLIQMLEESAACLDGYGLYDFSATVTRLKGILCGTDDYMPFTCAMEKLVNLTYQLDSERHKSAFQRLDTVIKRLCNGVTLSAEGENAYIEARRAIRTSKGEELNWRFMLQQLANGADYGKDPDYATLINKIAAAMINGSSEMSFLEALGKLSTLTHTLGSSYTIVRLDINEILDYLYRDNSITVEGAIAMRNIVDAEVKRTLTEMKALKKNADDLYSIMRWNEPCSEIHEDKNMDKYDILYNSFVPFMEDGGSDAMEDFTSSAENYNPYKLDNN